VAKDGSNDNPGTEARPFLTISKAAKVVQAGDTVFVKEGVYPPFHITSGHSGTADKRITFKRYGYDKVIIDAYWSGAGAGYGPYYGIEIDESYITIDGFMIEHALDTGILFFTAEHGLAKNNIVFENNAACIEFYKCSGQAINNLCVNNSAGIFTPAYNADEIIVKNNTSLNNHEGADLRYYSREADEYFNVYSENNIAGNLRKDSRTEDTVVNLSSDYNCFFPPVSSDSDHLLVKYQANGTTTIDFYYNKSADFSKYQTDTGLDLHSMRSNPNFVTADNPSWIFDSFYLNQSTSPGLNAGNPSDSNELNQGLYYGTDPAHSTYDTGIIDIGYHYDYGNNPDRYPQYTTSTEIALSKKINSDIEKNIQKAILSANQDLNGQTINYFLSADGGSHWEEVSLEQEHIFAYPGNDLRWKAELKTDNLSKTPIIYGLKIKYFYLPDTTIDSSFFEYSTQEQPTTEVVNSQTNFLAKDNIDPGATTAAYASSPNNPSVGVKPNSSLVGYWKMDESSWDGTAGEVIDSSGYRNNGRCIIGTGGEISSNCVSGNCGYFSGYRECEEWSCIGRDCFCVRYTPGGHIEICNVDSTANISEVTIEAWVNMRAFEDSDDFSYVVGENSWEEGYGGWFLAVGGTLYPGRPLFGIEAGDGINYDAAISPDALDTGTWYHLVGTYNGSTIKIYVNGELKNSKTYSGNLKNSGDLCIRIAGSSQNNNYLAGKIDEVRVYNRTLTAQEIQNHYQAYLPRPR